MNVSMQALQEAEKALVEAGIDQPLAAKMVWQDPETAESNITLTPTEIGKLIELMAKLLIPAPKGSFKGELGPTMTTLMESGEYRITATFVGVAEEMVGEAQDHFTDDDRATLVGRLLDRKLQNHMYDEGYLNGWCHVAPETYVEA